MNSNEQTLEVGPPCTACGFETRKVGASVVYGGEQADGLWSDLAWSCVSCGHRFEDAALARQNEAAQVSAARLRKLAQSLMRSSESTRKLRVSHR